MSPTIDVAGILDRAGADSSAAEGSQAWALAKVSEVVIELIEADQEYDEAMREAHARNEFSLRAQQASMNRLVAARARRQKALRNVQAVRS